MSLDLGWSDVSSHLYQCMCIFWQEHHESEVVFFLVNFVVLSITGDINFSYLIEVPSARFFYVKITIFGL